ncbi:MAG: molybdopterin-dependent oxidoreductase [Dehalococcoidia bacterium]
MVVETKQTFCRFCHAFCGIEVELENGRALKVKGDPLNPMYQGFTCIKGRQLPEQHYHPDRLLWSQKRQTDGSFAPIPHQQAIDEVAAKLSQLLRDHGPRSIATYSGTYGFSFPSSGAFGGAFMAGIGSGMRFSGGTIDQPGKPIARAYHGNWTAGPQMFDDADTWMLIGANPTISMWGGIPQYNPAKRLHEAKKRGMKFIVIDPRVTEAAEKADIHLQVKPGEDSTLLAGILRVIISEGLYDGDFIQANVKGFEELREAVDSFTLDYVEERAGVPATLVAEAARTFAGGQRGSVTSGTGPDFTARGNLIEYLINCINTVTGRWLREGERVPNPPVLRAPKEYRAQVVEERTDFENMPKMRVRDLPITQIGPPTSALADEILLPGEGQIKALICIGANPMAAWPDQLKTIAALKNLELLVTLDIKMSATAKLAHYVIAPKLSFEREDTTLPNEALSGTFGFAQGYPAPYAQYGPKLIEAPEGSDVIEEWEFFWGLANKMRTSLPCGWGPVSIDEKPTTSQILEWMTATSRISLDEVKKYPHGHIFEDEAIRVLPREPGKSAKLNVGHAVPLTELAEVRGEPIMDGGYREGEEFSHRLVSRRMVHVYNSSGRDLPKLMKKGTTNPAFMHPRDLEEFGLNPGDVIEISSARASILAVAEPAPDVRPGVISMAHAWGDVTEEDHKVRTIGSNVGRLSDVENGFDKITGLPLMSAIPVNIRRVAEPVHA